MEGGAFGEKGGKASLIHTAYSLVWLQKPSKDPIPLKDGLSEQWTYSPSHCLQGRPSFSIISFSRPPPSCLVRVLV